MREHPAFLVKYLLLFSQRQICCSIASPRGMAAAS